MRSINVKIGFMKNFKVYILSALAGAWMVSCSEDDKLTVDIQENVERGAVLRTISTDGTAWNSLDTSETFTVVLEEQDLEDGALLDEVRVFVNLVDNTPAATTTTSETQIATIPASDFTFDVNNLPRTTYAVSLADVETALGIVLGDYNCGDVFAFRLELELTDGRVFTDTDLTGTVQGGSFFASPFAYNISLISLLPSDDLYTGSYALTQTSPGIFGVSDYQDGTYTVESIANTIKVIRNVPTFPAFGPFGPVDVQFEFICGEIVLTAGQGVGAGCNGTINSGPADVNATYDEANPDDSAFNINFTSDEDDDCQTGTAQAVINLVKQ